GSGDSWPAAQSGRTVVGFTVTYTGEFAPNTVATVPFRVTTDAATPAKVDNVVQTGGSSAAGDATPATATATLTVTPLVVDSIVKKSLTPDSVSGVVGQELVASLEAEVKDSTAPVRRIVLEDPPHAPGGSTLWGAFEVQELVGAKVPAGGTMQVQIGNGTAWVDHGDPVRAPRP